MQSILELSRCWKLQTVNRNWCFILSVLMAFGAASVPLCAEEPTLKTYFVFLVSGKSTSDTPVDEVQQMQKAHLGNFSRLAKQGDLLAAGPSSDPNGKIRGIVVLSASTLAAAEQMFANDPYLQGGYLVAEIHEQHPLAGKVVPILDAVDLEKSVMVILETGEAWNPAEAAKVRDRLQSASTEWHADERLGFASWFVHATDCSPKRLFVLLFRGDDIPSVRQQIEQQPFVQNQSVTYQAIGQYMAAGTMPK